MHAEKKCIMYDLVVVGAGLHALTLLCALLEDNPMATELIDAIKGSVRSKLSERSMRKKLMERRRMSTEEMWKGRRILVVDRFGAWLQNWRRQFEVLQIDRLRSNAALHPDPFDPEMLIEFAQLKGLNTDEAFEEITGIQRGRQFVGPFQVPKTSVFNAFCEFLIDSYKLRDAVMPAEVVSIVPYRQGSEGGYAFRVEMKDGTRVASRRVVLSIGHTNLPNDPDWVDRSLYPPSALSHVWELVHQDISKLSGCALAIVGGGLTAVQLSQLAINSGCASVSLISRRPLTVRPFDSDLTWSGKQRHAKLARFWNEPCMEKRFQLIREARRGGTITPAARDALSDMVSKKQVVLLEGIEIWDAEWDGDAFHLDLSNGEPLTVNKIWLATGSSVDVHREALLATIIQNFPVDFHAGYPVLDADLKWHPELELHFIGGYASLALGPDGVNLAGARRAAFRLRDYFRTHSLP